MTYGSPIWRLVGDGISPFCQLKRAILLRKNTRNKMYRMTLTGLWAGGEGYTGCIEEDNLSGRGVANN